MDSDKVIMGTIEYNGKKVFDLIDIGGTSYADVKCSSRKHGFQYKQMPAVELVCETLDKMKQEERLEVYCRISKNLNKLNSLSQTERSSSLY